MNHENKALRFALAAITCAALAACGGGGDDDADAGTAPAGGERGATIGGGSPSISTTPATGSVSTPFVAGANGATFALLGRDSQGAGGTVVQAPGGALTQLGGTTLSGASARTLDIAGDAYRAQGRWVEGTVTNTTTSSTSTLTGKDNNTYHYLALRRLAAWPASGTASCDSGRFTTPTYSGGTAANSAAYTGTVEGSASVSFGSDGAAITLHLDAAGNGSTATGDFRGKSDSPGSWASVGSYHGSGTGASLSVGDGGNGSYIVGTAYRVTMANGSTYIGVASFRCK